MLGGLVTATALTWFIGRLTGHLGATVVIIWPACLTLCCALAVDTAQRWHSRHVPPTHIEPPLSSLSPDQRIDRLFPVDHRRR